MAKLTLNDVTSGYGTATRINANNTLIENALENTLSRDGTSPNTMSASLDMNSNRIINLAAPVGDNDAARLADIENVSVAVSDALAAQTAAAAAEDSAAASAVTAAAAAASLSAFVSTGTFTLSLYTASTGGSAVASVTARYSVFNSDIIILTIPSLFYQTTEQYLYLDGMVSAVLPTTSSGAPMLQAWILENLTRSVGGISTRSSGRWPIFATGPNSSDQDFTTGNYFKGISGEGGTHQTFVYRKA